LNYIGIGENFYILNRLGIDTDKNELYFSDYAMVKHPQTDRFSFQGLHINLIGTHFKISKKEERGFTTEGGKVFLHHLD